MQVEVLMPKMGESITEGKVVKWHKKTGEKVDRDEVLLEISTDKVDTEIPSVAAGVVSKILVQEQDIAQVGTVIAYIETAVEKDTGEEEKKSNDLASSERAQKFDDTMPRSVGLAEQELRERNGDRFYSPLVRSMARTEGISATELTAITGSGFGGRVTKNDLRDYVASRNLKEERAGKRLKSTNEESVLRVPASADSVSKVIPMDDMRQLVMGHMIKSRDTSVHVAAITEVDMSVISEFVSKRGEEFLKQEGFKLTFMPFIAASCVRALKDFPLVNCSVDGTNIVLHDRVNLGIAVAIETKGLLVPVVKAADERSLLGLARGIHDLAVRARTKRLTGDDTIGSTFSITNYGVFGNLMGTPIINQPNVAILGVGAVKKRPVVINDAIAIRHMGFLTLSFDHRLVDGALGGQFLERIVYYLEKFDTAKIL
jgi:2-oxoglutarate dehydrogenase E2 component (dihydrolipoamide succinyltransferase)